jgi:hypothetical protein
MTNQNNEQPGRLQVPRLMGPGAPLDQVMAQRQQARIAMAQARAGGAFDFFRILAPILPGPEKEAWPDIHEYYLALLSLCFDLYDGFNDFAGESVVGKKAERVSFYHPLLDVKTEEAP